MGLALDEPKEGDEHYKVDGLEVVIDPFASKLVKDAGGLNITNSIFGPMAELRGVQAAGCC
ncbi:MAG: hypothetical protein AB1473_22650 [Thermodesulfobacteriota bacterium]